MTTEVGIGGGITGEKSSAKGSKSKRHLRSEIIRFNEAQGMSGYAIRENSELVSIYPSRSNQKLPESRMKIRNLVDYTWDVLYGNGRLLASHITRRFLAYAIKMSAGGGIRIVDLETNERILIKGSRGLIKDVEFVHKFQDLVIGFIDDYGTCYIYKITKDTKSNLLQTFLIFEIAMDGPPVRSDFRRFIWCKFVSDQDIEPLTPKDGSFHFGVIQNNLVYVANLCQLVERYGEGRHNWSDFKGNFMEIDQHTSTVTDASFAPDGTALATASQDGTVKFFQVYVLGEEPTRCLFSWAPHDGRTVSKIFFLDDHSVSMGDSEGQYWKYMITAGPSMSEIKLWSCKEWVCLQTLKFCCPSPSQLKMDLHNNARFLVVGDVHRKTMFVVNIFNSDDSARFEWINEFSLPCMMISFNVTGVRLLTVQEIETGGYEDYMNEVMDSGDQLCVLDVSYVQPKSLQQGTVAFRPPTELCQASGPSPSRITFDSAVSYIEGQEADLSDSPVQSSDEEEMVEMKTTGNNEAATSSGQRRSVSPNRSTSKSPKAQYQQPASLTTLNLSQQLSNLLLNTGPSFNGMKPAEKKIDLPFEDAFNGHPSAIPCTSGIDDISGLKGSLGAQKVDEGGTFMYNPHNQPRGRSSSRSSNASRASSSPSREVEEILSPKNELGSRRSDMSQTMEACLKENNFDEDGNILSNDAYPPQFKASPIISPKAGFDNLPQMPLVLQQVSSIMNMMQAQSEEMKELKREVSRLNTAQAASSRQLDETAMSRALDNYFSTNNIQVQRLEDCVKNMLSMERQRPAAQGLPTNFAESITSNIAKLIKMQMESTILPSILTLFEPVRSQVQAELVKLVLNAEGRIKQELKHILQSQEFKDSLSADLEANMKPSCELLIPRVLLTSIVPNFEKSLQSMYLKINETFMKGTKEYIGGLEGTLVKRETASKEDLKYHLNSMQDNISSVLQVELESQMLRVLSSLQTTLVKQIEETVARELSRAFRDQQKYLESSIIPRAGAITPALSVSEHNASFASPPVDPEVLMNQLFKMSERGDTHGAFTQASHYSDITYMMRLAEKTDPSKVFTSKLLPQTYVAIIQQMATVDLSAFTETKITYLNCALSSVNMSDKKVLRSLARIAPVFAVASKKYADQNQGSPNIPKLRLLEFTFNGICSQNQ